MEGEPRLFLRSLRGDAGGDACFFFSIFGGEMDRDLERSLGWLSGAGDSPSLRLLDRFSGSLSGLFAGLSSGLFSRLLSEVFAGLSGSFCGLLDCFLGTGGLGDVC